MIKGFTFVEMLVSVAIVGIVLLALADFSSDTLNASDKQSQQLMHVQDSRLAVERIGDMVNRAAYIYPAEQSLTLEITSEEAITDGEVASINTSNAIAILVPSIESDAGNLDYFFTAFYLRENSNGRYDLYEFSSSQSVTWDVNDIPAENYSGYAGTTTLLASNVSINNSELSYILNFDNGLADSNLKGEVNQANADDQDALIKGISWRLQFSSGPGKNISVKGLAKNVPRFIP